LTEYNNLDETLDQISSYLDEIEQRNDSLFARLEALLEKNRETRKELEAERLSRENSEAEKDSNSNQTGSS